MIARLWRGWTSDDNADAYERLLRTEIIPGIERRAIAGFRGIELLRRQANAETEFVTVMLFESLQSVRAFAGAEYERAVVPPAARALLNRFDERSAHYEVRHPRTPVADDSGFYTHAEWLVLPGREEEFIAAWKRLAEAFAALERPPIWGTLLRSTTDARLFYSFGPWRSAEDVGAMRAHAPTQALLQHVRDLCERSSPGGFERVAHANVAAATLRASSVDR